MDLTDMISSFKQAFTLQLKKELRISTQVNFSLLVTISLQRKANNMKNYHQPVKYLLRIVKGPQQTLRSEN